MARKLRKKTSKKKRDEPGALKVVSKVRLPQKLALELHTLGRGGHLGAAELHLRMLRPELSADVAHEVAFRCADPSGRGGVETGTDPVLGEYADIAITVIEG